ncbi:MAG: alpha/beta hydrolase, partial [Syntrophales bacterium]|nr:alpha/beta hydrolase [Syntrophales bacterium]
GYDVWTPTLTGLGERSHLLNPAVSLTTHIQDVAQLIRYEGLKEVILVGHSYGGIVVTGVADREPEAIRQIIYLDALVVESGQAMVDLYDHEIRLALARLVETEGEGWRCPPSRPLRDPRFSDHPYRTMIEPLELRNGEKSSIPRSFIFCTEKEDMGPRGQGIIRSAQRAKMRGWSYFELKTGHHPMWEAPDALTALLLDLVEGR